jgi:hypothetical protein
MMQMMERRSSYYGESYQWVAANEVSKYEARGWRVCPPAPERSAREHYESVCRSVAAGMKVSPEVVERWRKKAEMERAA